MAGDLVLDHAVVRFATEDDFVQVMRRHFVDEVGFLSITQTFLTGVMDLDLIFITHAAIAVAAHELSLVLGAPEHVPVPAGVHALDGSERANAEQDGQYSN